MSCLLALLCFAATTITVHAQDDYPPGSFQLTADFDRQLQPTRLIVPYLFTNRDLPASHNIMLNLPPGFKVRLFAIGRELQKTRFMAFSPEGVLHVASMKRYNLEETGSEIIAFPDRNQDGMADEAIVAASGLAMAHSLAFYEDAMYVAEARRIIRLKDLDGDGIYEQRQVLVDDIPAEGWHTTRTIVIDERNEKILVGVGMPCDLCRSENPLSGGSLDPLVPTPEWGSILQFNLDGSGRRIYARGVRNTVGLTMHPVTNQLWGTNNGHDLEGPHLPPEWIDIIPDGGFMGFPFVYGYQVPVNFSIGRYRDAGVLPLRQQDSLLIASQRRPVALVPAHLAPMDIHFYTGDLFPAQYHNAAFVALRGGQTGGNLARVPGFKVISLHSEPDGSGARLADFMTGFGTDPQGSSVWGKPVGIASDRFGHLYVTSDYRMDAVFRIEPGPLLGTLEHNLPDTLSNASVLPLSATVRLSRFSDTGKSPTLTADLSPYGGSAREPFTEVEAGLYRLDRSLEIEGDVGARPLVVRAEQSIDGETEVLEFRRQFVILPAFDIEILTGSLTPGWKVEATSGAHVLDQDGDPGEAFQVTAEGFGATWSVAFDTAEPADALGYSGLRFAFRAQDLDIPPVPQFVVILNGLKLDLARGPEPYRLDFARQDWQILEIPLKEFTHVTSNGGANATVVTDKVDRIDAIRFEGNVTGTIHLDSMRVVTEGRPTVLPSLVREAQVGSRPTRFALEQNYPNPFNSETTIRFHLPRSQQIELAIYNLGAQRVATLVQGHREAGSYSVRWDGLDDAGLELASGVYFYRLTAGERVETKKLLLLR